MTKSEKKKMKQLEDEVARLDKLLTEWRDWAGEVSGDKKYFNNTCIEDFQKTVENRISSIEYDRDKFSSDISEKYNEIYKLKSKLKKLEPFACHLKQQCLLTDLFKKKDEVIAMDDYTMKRYGPSDAYQEWR